MSIELRATFNGKCHEIYVGNLTLLFSYETLVGFAVPGIGRITSENIWGSTTGKHINSWPAKHSKIDRETFTKAEEALNRHLSLTMTRPALIKYLERLLDIAE